MDIKRVAVIWKDRETDKYAYGMVNAVEKDGTVYVLKKNIPIDAHFTGRREDFDFFLSDCVEIQEDSIYSHYYNYGRISEEDLKEFIRGESPDYVITNCDTDFGVKRAEKYASTPIYNTTR